MSIDTSRVTDSIYDAVRVEYEEGLGIPVGDGVAPAATGDALSLTRSFLVVSMVPLGRNYLDDGYAGPGGSMGWIRYQLTAVGVNRAQTDRLANNVAQFLTDTVTGPARWVNALAPTGHTIQQRRRAGPAPLDNGGGRFQAAEFVEFLAIED